MSTDQHCGRAVENDGDQAWFEASSEKASRGEPGEVLAGRMISRRDVAQRHEHVVVFEYDFYGMYLS